MAIIMVTENMVNTDIMDVLTMVHMDMAIMVITVTIAAAIIVAKMINLLNIKYRYDYSCRF